MGLRIAAFLFGFIGLLLLVTTTGIPFDMIVERLFTGPCLYLFIIAQVLIMVAASLKCCCGCGRAGVIDGAAVAPASMPQMAVPAGQQMREPPGLLMKCCCPMCAVGMHQGCDDPTAC